MRKTESNLSRGLLCAAAFFLLPLAGNGQRSIDFSDLVLSPESHYNGSDGAGGFSSGGASFNNFYDDGFWGGWAYSNVTDNTTPGWENQYSAITGGGIGANGIYGIAYVDTFTPTFPRIVLPESEAILGIQVTNTTYAYTTMRDGDDFAKKFGGADGDDPDFFLLTITGLAADESPTGSVEFYLADYRFEDNALDYIVDVWTWVDLGGLGETTRILEFTLESSDTGIFGMNTPAYFALGEVTVIPEPRAFALLGGLVIGIAVLGLRGRRAGGNRGIRS